MKNREIEERLKLAEQYKQEALYGIVKGQEFYKDGYNSAKKEMKKKLKDEYNSWLKELNNPKLYKVINQEQRIKIESKIELLKELLNEKTLKN